MSFAGTPAALGPGEIALLRRNGVHRIGSSVAAVDLASMA